MTVKHSSSDIDDWNAFGCGLSQSLILSTADIIAKTGLRDLGYHYVILDDCWSSSRGSNNQIMPNSTKFPNGMAWLGDQIHAQGLRFGIYSSAGTKTVCQDKRSKKNVFLNGVFKTDRWLLVRRLPGKSGLWNGRRKYLRQLGGRLLEIW